MSVFEKCVQLIKCAKVELKIRYKMDITFDDFMVAVSSARLVSKIDTEERPVIVNLPRNIVFRGADNIVFEGNVRVHSTKNFVMSTHGTMSTNPASFKQNVAATSAQIDEHVANLHAEAEANAEMFRRINIDGNSQTMLM